MKKVNTILAAVLAGLFLISALSYYDSVRQAERFERGQKFLPNLNPDEIAEIVIRKGGETTQLERQGEEFVLASENGYPAKNESVNRFIKDVLGLSLEKEVGTSENLFGELELAGGEENTLEIAFLGSGGNEMVRFLVGKAFDGGGNYVRRVDVEESIAYLSSSRVYFSTDADDFLKKDLLDVKAADLAAIEGAGYRFEDQEGSLKLATLPAGMKERTSEVNLVTGALSFLRFTQHHLANAPEVQGLRFDSQVVFDLKDDSGYQVSVAEKDGKHYLQIQGFHNTPQVQISLEADEEEVKEKSEILARGDEIQQFNDFHGSWIYEVAEATANKFRLKASELYENA